jgi:hypothetical protein
MLLFCDIDENGNITTWLHGRYVVPTRQYQHFFYLTEEIDVTEYEVIDGQLFPKDVI